MGEDVKTEKEARLQMSHRVTEREWRKHGLHGVRDLKSGEWGMRKEAIGGDEVDRHEGNPETTAMCASRDTYTRLAQGQRRRRRRRRRQIITRRKGR